jgi:hypothetical protein
MASLLRRGLPISAQAAAMPNHVLQLDGDGDYGELPPNILTNPTEATVELWAKRDAFHRYSRIFDSGAPSQSMCLFKHPTIPDLRSSHPQP